MSLQQEINELKTKLNNSEEAIKKLSTVTDMLIKINNGNSNALQQTAIIVNTIIKLQRIPNEKDLQLAFTEALENITNAMRPGPKEPGNEAAPIVEGTPVLSAESDRTNSDQSTGNAGSPDTGSAIAESNSAPLRDPRLD